MKKTLIFQTAVFALAVLLCSTAAGWAGQLADGAQPPVNLTEYYPLNDGNTWTYQQKD